jgi:hypothetical protein
MSWKSLFNWKIVIATLVFFVGLNSLLIAIHNFRADQTGVIQCITEDNRRCRSYCEDGVDAEINDTKGKTGQIFKASEICCCSIYRKYPYSKIILAPYYIPLIYSVLLVAQIFFSKIKHSDKK